MSTGKPLSYSNWAANQPDHKVTNGEVEHCLEMNYMSQWNDNLCNQGLRLFVCQIEGSS